MEVQSTHKETKCPITRKILSEENVNEQIRFECGHVYHTSTFLYFELQTFKCQVFGCLKGNVIAVVTHNTPTETTNEIIDIEEYVDVNSL
jgi:hypothetical protein